MVKARTATPRTAKELAEHQAKRRQAQMRRVYDQRDDLLIALTKVLPSHLMPTKRAAVVAGSDDDWLWSVCVHGPEQLVWPLDNRSAGRFGHLPRSPANHWDGHTSEERSRRIDRLPTCDPPLDS